ncbi:peptidylprolyl isomerase [Prosthecochloris sp. N3]|uniref:Peptidylprolyl isomerase n=1 Tax=Prosthecochloris ethylica TaxID=2743976 RepID=A0ABR9XRD9_9CHLB|nr:MULTISPECIES: peptidylprolyl isomerase [Prosthecochloris]MBF0586012.1 peptidylprolyl isomerase [Prosthecochloris ethylica]MBF0636588.1 peptidylprolyl isomerase [Prosthecochloris ethylica]NUK47220.1 peptidylprolyl isomerase [Prosthecochloris ethylica]RNA64026.1 peptidylprolyl isomerase [Prosthecochloris sp. ZM_2]
MKKAVFRIFIACALLGSPALTSPATAATVVDGIAAVVGNEIILQSEIEEQAVLTQLQFPEASDDKDLRKQILDNLVMQKIVLTKAKLDSVTVNESRIDTETDQKLMFLRERFSSIEAMEKRFAKPYAVIEKEIREDIRNQQLIESLRRERMSGVTVTYEEVEEFYEQNRKQLPVIPESVRISQIVLYPQVTAASKAAARERVEEALLKLREGADFAEIAREYSQDPGSAAVGGDLGYSKRGEFVKPFEEAAFALEKGEVSGIVETRYGYHIIQVLERKNDTIHTRHILAVFDRSNLDREAARERLADIRQAVLDGKESFADMAKQYSDDPVSAASGGVIRQKGSGGVDGLFPVSSLKEPLKGIVGSLDDEGDISRPVLIEVESGEPFYAIFRLDRKVPRHTMDLSKDYARLEQLAIDRKQQARFAEWVDSLKKEIYIRVYGSDV